MPTSPKATTLPGGAPLKKRSSRPCKYGPRDSEGRCPKKPKTPRKSTGAKSKPCKYGPRDAQGRCPKKPKAPRSERAPTVKEYKSVDSAARQAGEVLRSKKATKEQKRAAVKVAATAVGGEVAKKVGEHTYREAKKAVRQNKAAVKSAAKSAAPYIVKGLAYTGAIAAILAAGGAALTAQRRKEADAYARQQLALTVKRLAPQQLTAEQQQQLYNQYFEYKAREPVQNPYLGK